MVCSTYFSTIVGNFLHDLLELLYTTCGRFPFVAFRGAAASNETWPTVPLLMLAEKKDSDDDHRELYSPSTGKVCMRISLPEAKDKKCIESRGWLITLGKSGEISLLHPFYRAQIPLPNLNTLPEYEDYADNCADPQLHFLHRAVLSANPTDTSDFVLMVVHSAGMHLGFWRPGDKSWTRIESRGAFSDVNYYNGKFYAISFSGIVWVWDVFVPDLTVAQSIMMIDRRLYRTRCGHLVESSGILDSSGYPYLVESSSGDLLVVARNGMSVDDNDDYGATHFKVIQLDVNKPEWKEIKSLGSDAVFVGHNAAFSVDATRFGFPDTIIKPNCVYFTDDCFEAYYESERGGGKDMGIFHLEDGRIERFQDVESFSPISPPLWVAPSFPSHDCWKLLLF